MGETSGSAKQPRGVRLSEELDTDRELWWTGVRALLQANEAERKAIEDYLHLLREENRTIDDGDIDDLIDAAIANHQRALEDLRLAKQSVEALSTER